MRFNDLMQTVLAAEGRGDIGATTLWRQCVDMLAQHDRSGSQPLEGEVRSALVTRLQQVRERVTETQRVASVVELGSRLRSPALVELFASDRPAVCVAAMIRANLPDGLWADLIPRLNPVARGVLRGRKDMGPLAVRALEQFGAVDLLLPPSGEQVQVERDTSATLTLVHDVEVPDGEAVMELTAPMQADAPVAEAEDRSQIRELVERIERFTTSGRPRPIGERAEETPAQPTPRQFPFETDADGNLIWVGDASRAALVGLSIGEAAVPGTSGADGHIAGAFARRSSFQHGRFWISDGAFAGEWRLSAIPFFDQRSGRFQGYRGQARRPHIHEVPYTPQQAPQGEEISLDSMRQLVHELRTPLNAILGFAEIIEQQLFGPADIHYREMAGNILVDARRLLSAFDDLDLAARTSALRQTQDSKREAQDVEPLIDRMIGHFRNDPRFHGANGAPIYIAIAAALPPILLDPVQGERMIQHLLRTLLSISGPDEAVQGSVWLQPDGQGGRVHVALDKPRRLRGLEEAQLLDPGYGADGDWPDAPLLGVGFSLRLVRSLADAQDASMIIDTDRIILSLPVSGAKADSETARS